MQILSEEVKHSWIDYNCTHFKKQEIFEYSGAASPFTAPNMVIENFDVTRCSQISDCEPRDYFAHRLPAPEKFPKRSNKPQHRNTKYISHRDVTYYKERSSRVIGTMIASEEKAQWSCTEKQRQSSVQTAAELIVGHRHG